MERYFVVKDGIITDLIKADDDFVSNSGLQLVLFEPGYNVGDLYSDGNFSLGQKPVVVISPIDPMRLRLGLTHFGWREDVENLVANGTQDMKDAYEYSVSVERESPMVNLFKENLGKTDQEVDQLFNYCNSLIV